MTESEKAEVIRYAYEVSAFLEKWGAAVERVGSACVHYAEGKITYQALGMVLYANGGILRAQHKRVEEITPPQPVAHLHVNLLDAVSDMSVALRLLFEGFDNDSSDPTAMAQGDALTRVAGRKIVLFQKNLIEYLLFQGDLTQC